jgi:dTDP-4-amino-4,6-dideoxygalactose transaminase
MRAEFLPFFSPSIGPEEIDEVTESLRSGWLSTGPKVGRFEKEFTGFVGAEAALAVSSATAAMHIALATLGIGPGDAVVTTAMTFASTVHVIEQVGARALLADVEPDTLNIDPEAAERVVATHEGPERIRAMLPVHLYGHPCNMDRLLELAASRELVIVEDAAHALPAAWSGKMIGAPIGGSDVPVLTCFSFYATKNLTTGEGGMLTGPPSLVEEARPWALHGMTNDAWGRYGASGSWWYDVTRPGFKYNMTDLQASLGLAQLRKLPAFHARRRELVARYDEGFARIREVQTPTTRDGVDHAHHLYVLRLRLDRLTISRDRFIEELRARNIGTSVHFIPVHLHSYYRKRYGYHEEDFPIAYREFLRIVSLPLYPDMTDQDADDVVEAVGDVVARFGR